MGRLWRRTAGGLGLAVLMLALGTGCGADNSNTRASYQEPGFSDAGAPMPRDAVMAEVASMPDRGFSADFDAPTAISGEAFAAREIITTADVTLVADDPTQAAAELAALTEQAGGRVDGRWESRGNEYRAPSASLELRVPSGMVNTVIDGFAAFGEVSDVSLSHDDVTAQVRDLDARVTALETSIDRLLELLAMADNTADLLQVENELTFRQAELDGLRAWRASLSEQVALSTVRVFITTPDGGVIPQPSRGFTGGLAGGWEALASFGRGLLVALGAVLPWLGILGLLTLAWLPLRRRRKQAKARRQQQQPPQYPHPHYPQHPQPHPQPQHPGYPGTPPQP